MSDEFDIHGDADTGDVADAQGDGGPSVTVAAPRSASDGLPGFAVDGHPDWRAGVFGPGRGLLGMARVSDLVARREDHGRLMQVSDPVLDQEQNSWRWNDPTALAYDVDRKLRQKAQAETMANAVEAFGDISEFLPPLPRGGGLLTGLAGGYMGHLEAGRIQKEIDAFKARQDQLRALRGS